MTTNTLLEETERELRALATELTEPADGECLLCYLDRMLDQFGCTTELRWATRYRDLRAPRATALVRRLGQVGGCDCEVFINGYQLAREHWIPPRRYVEDGITYETDPQRPDPMPSCRGVRRGSTRGCSLWVRGTGSSWDVW
ncbi:DUF2695 domain-containing protein [Desertihabitans aurantiacus]|uniref:DUF2695 domain-containing protein n=1 Tax=Desertihabitans aurantiacus TaxID=2282477 RepID=UPI000DF80A42|nr:DUF2695 domain-containing protein [Desertihabitans aurantiacus]